jgi:ribonuclease Z
MSLGYIVTEPPTYEPLDLDSILPMIESQFEALSKLTPPIRHPRQVTSILTKTLRPYTLPDGQILQPPVRAKTTPRKIVIFGDCCGTDNAAFLEMVKEPSLLVHEATNAWIDPELEFAGKAKGISAAEDLADASSGEVEAAHRIAKDRVANRSKGRGHSDAETTGLFAKSIAAQRVAVNHFSAM